MSMQIYLVLFGAVTFLSGFVCAFFIYHEYKCEYEKTIKPDVTLEQMKTSEENISRFLQEHQLNKGANIWAIAEVLKVNEGGEDSSIDDEARLSEPDKNGNMVVTFKAGLKPEQKIFNFAHECAHLINKDDVPVTRPTGSHKAPIEQLADYTAAALLMPVDDVFCYLESNNYKTLSSRSRMKILRFMCKKYEVSEIIALRRIQEVYKIKIGMDDE